MDGQSDRAGPLLNTDNQRLLLQTAQALLRANDTGGFIKPGPAQYPHQWNWDSAFAALGLAYFDMARARAEVRSLLRAQWRDGMVPHIVYPTGPSDYFPPPAFWQTERSAAAGPLPSSGLTQPPILTTVVRQMHGLAAEDPAGLDFLREVYPRLLAWHRWLHTARDPEGSGLVAIVHPWESGMDDSPRWQPVLAAIEPAPSLTFTRRDRVHVAADERPVEEDYRRFIHLITLFRSWAYDPQALYERSPFLVQDAAFNAILHQADHDLLALAHLLGEDTRPIEQWISRTRSAFARLWDEADGTYYDYDLRGGRRLRVNTIAGLVPLFAGLPEPAQAERLLREHLLHPGRFAPDGGTRFWVPSCAKDQPGWDPRRYWRGPVWLNTNWLVLRGLERYGYAQEARAVADHSLELVRRSGFREYYDPRDGSGAGSLAFTWSAALTLDLLHRPPGTTVEW